MKNKWMFGVIVILLITVGAFSWKSYLQEYSQEDKVNIHVFPQEIDGWTAEELKITEKEYAILETRNAFVRQYTHSSGAQVQLFVVYSEHNRKVSHPPEICYTGGGMTILGTEPMTVSSSYEDRTFPVNVITMEQGALRQFSAYWFKVGDSFTPNYWKQQGLIAMKSLLGQNASSALIRVSSFVEKEESDEEAKKRIADFVGMIVPHIFHYLP